MSPTLQPEPSNPTEVSEEQPIEAGPLRRTPLVFDEDRAYSFDQAWRDVIRATQSWVQLGTFGFAIFCILIGAVEALLGR